MTAPAITDRLPVSLRAYAAPQFSPVPDAEKPTAKAKRPAAPASSWTLIFDCETSTHPGQALRFGAYQFRNGDELDEAGIFYDPDGVTADELETLRNHATGNGLELRTRESFVDDVFFKRAYQLRATIVGFNLPFDISRLAISHATARTPVDSMASAMHGGFTFKLSAHKIYPNVRVKHLSQRTALISFAATMQQRDSRVQRKRELPTPIRRGHFIDVKTLAGALFARGFSLASLSQFLKVEHPKLDFDDFDRPITDEMVRYAVRDVQATWECYREVMTRIARLGLSRTIPEKIYSEASIGKGYLREMGVTHWRKCQPDFPRDLIAKIMGSYFGGRSEIRIRREVRQVILCDFLSMYPTVCTLMGLWKFVIADGMTWQDTTDETREFVEAVDLDMLQSQSTWARLATLVRVLPDGDIFPVRAEYPIGKAHTGEGQSTIGANYLTSTVPLWFTLADCIAAKLLNGKAPMIIEAISFAPGPVQSDLAAIEISGNPDYRVDPNITDFFKRVIELRQSIKKRRDVATGDEKGELDTEQNALKIAANSTSYGIFIEVNVETGAKAKATTVHSSTCDPFSFKTDKSEMPGTFFHPLLGTLITGAARLMLATAERLVTDQGLDWSFCDTDSMAIAKPDAMPADEFGERARAVVDWFAALNPYAFGGSILKIEDVNASLETDEPEPLYCWAVSSKRYALFNIDATGAPILRKVSAHGLGHLIPPYRDDDAPPDLPTPHKSVLGNGIERWHCDLWHQIVSAALAGRPDQVRLDYHPALSKTALSRYSATTPELLRWFSTYNRDRPYRDQVKPFGFLLSMMLGMDVGERIADPSKGRRKKPGRLKPVAPFDRDHDKAIASAFDRDTGEPVSASSLKSYADALAQYHVQPESKFLNGNYTDRGTTLRRHVEMTETNHIGKESHDWERQAMIGLSVDSEIGYGIAVGERRALVDKLREFMAECGERKAAAMLGMSVSRLKGFASDEKGRDSYQLARNIAAKLPAALALRAKLSHDRHAESHRLSETVNRDGLRETARRLKTDPSNLRRRLERYRVRRQTLPC
ncbi:hypothetical protein [Sphingomonas sp.]|uniref:hypothetical protein n=1 Tax=Sphingomonas sp. TaxID=28214 RepID=UPI0025ECFFC8|nr:hypothetical protein [Sphingomonas sp.]